MILPESTEAAVPLQLTRLNCERDSVQPVLNKIRVLIADDNLRSARLLSERLTQEGYVCEIAPSGDKALEIVQHHACSIVICDVRNRGQQRI